MLLKEPEHTGSLPTGSREGSTAPEEVTDLLSTLKEKEGWFKIADCSDDPEKSHRVRQFLLKYQKFGLEVKVRKPFVFGRYNPQMDTSDMDLP